MGMFEKSERKSELKEEEKVLAPMFSRDSDDLPRWLVLGGLPSSALHIFEAVNSSLGLGFSEKIESVWSILHKCYSQATGGAMGVSPDIKEGDVLVRGEDSGRPFEKLYSPRRVSNTNAKKGRKCK